MIVILTNGKIWWTARYECGIIVNRRDATHQYEVVRESATTTRIRPYVI
jgi:hypothetical protein